MELRERNLLAILSVLLAKAGRKQLAKPKVMQNRVGALRYSQPFNRHSQVTICIQPLCIVTNLIYQSVYANWI